MGSARRIVGQIESSSRVRRQFIVYGYDSGNQWDAVAQLSRGIFIRVWVNGPGALRSNLNTVTFSINIRTAAARRHFLMGNDWSLAWRVCDIQCVSDIPIRDNLGHYTMCPFSGILIYYKWVISDHTWLHGEYYIVSLKLMNRGKDRFYKKCHSFRMSSYIKNDGNVYTCQLALDSHTWNGKLAYAMLLGDLRTFLVLQLRWFLLRELVESY